MLVHTGAPPATLRRFFGALPSHAPHSDLGLDSVRGTARGPVPDWRTVHLGERRRLAPPRRGGHEKTAGHPYGHRPSASAPLRIQTCTFA